MKKKFVTLGIMMALSMTVAAGCGQKAGNETTAQETAESTVADTAAADTAAADSTVEDTTAADTTGADGAASETAVQHSQMAVISMYPQRRLWRRQKIRVPMCWM